MQPSLLTLRALVDEYIALLRSHLHSTPDLHETLQSLRTQLVEVFSRACMAIHMTSFSSIYTRMTRWFMKCARLCIEALDWLLLPRVVWKITVRHCIALLVLYFVKVFFKILFMPILRTLYNFIRPFFINREYLRQEKYLQEKMVNATCFTEWKKAASDLDRLQGRYHWKESSQSTHYDWRRIRDDLKRFRELVDEEDIRGIMAFSRSRLLRNLVGINDRRLYSHLRAGTKRLIEEYISEVVRALQLVCRIERTVSELEPTAEEVTDGIMPEPPVSTAEKLSFFNETRHAFGRSALLLSGGATLGLYHIGVCKSLHENNLLPRVLSGSSVGSIICAMVGTRTDDELATLFTMENNVIKLNFFPPNGGSWARKMTRLFTQGVLMDIRILKKCVKANIPPLTFQEAYELSGRIINIVVSPAMGTGNKDSLRLLNYLTAPNVLVWSAALASCAIPGVYAPVELLKKDERTGKLTSYMEGGAPIKWEDGSVQADLPMQRLSELFNINHFIVSQCLLNGTKILMADGTLKACEDVQAGDLLTGHRDELVVVASVTPNQPRSEVVHIVHDDGSEYTVSNEHRVTIRCNASPCVSFSKRGMRLSYMSSSVSWTTIDWRVHVISEQQDEEEEEEEEAEVEEEDEEKRESIMSKDEELILLQTSNDPTASSVIPSTVDALTGTKAQLKVMAIAQLNKLGRAAYLVRGQLAELAASELLERQKNLRCGKVGVSDVNPRVTGFKIPTLNSNTNEFEAIEFASSSDVNGSSELTLIALGDGKYDSFDYTKDRASVLYQHPNAMNVADQVWENASQSKSSTFRRRIEELQEYNKIEVNRVAGIIHSELSPIVSGAAEFDTLCSQSIDHVLTFNTSVIIAFGSSSRESWISAANSRVATGEFTNFTDSFVHGVRRLRFDRVITGSSASLSDMRTLTVWLSPHPCCWYLGEVVSRAIALAHGRTPQDYIDPNQILITRVNRLKQGAAPFLVTDIEIKSDNDEDRRYVLENGVVTHNCNPHVIPFVSAESSTHTLQHSFLTSPISNLIEYLCSQLKSTAINFLQLNMMPVHPSVKYVLDQKYLGDITLVPDVSPYDYTQLLSNPTKERLRRCIRVSELSTWRLMPAIRGACEIEFTLDECVRRMRGTLILEEITDSKKLRHLSRVRSWSSDLLAVGQHHALTHPTDDADENEGQNDIILPHGAPGGGRTQSEHNLYEPAVMRATSERLHDTHTRDVQRWKSRFEPNSSHASSAHTLSNLRATSVQEHQPEEDDVFSEDEEEHELRRQLKEQSSKVHSEDDDSRGEGEDVSTRCIDDEGIPRLKPAMTPIESTPTPVAVTASSSQNNLEAPDGIPSQISVDTTHSPSTIQAIPENDLLNTNPDANNASSSSSVPPKSRPPTTKRVNIFSPDTTSTTPIDHWNRSVAPAADTPTEPTPAPSTATMQPGTQNETSLARMPTPPVMSPRDPTTSPSAIVVPTTVELKPQSNSPISTPSLLPAASSSSSALPPRQFRPRTDQRAPRYPYSRSHPRTPSPPPGDKEVKLSEAEWNEERNSSRLSQLLKTSQTKVTNAKTKRNNARATVQPSSTADVSLHIPVVSFRHPPPRRMSTMDLAMLDQLDRNEQSSTGEQSEDMFINPVAPSSSIPPHSAGISESEEEENKDDDEEDEEQQHSDMESAEQKKQKGTLSAWINRASSFFHPNADSQPTLSSGNNSATHPRIRNRSTSLTPSMPHSPHSSSGSHDISEDVSPLLSGVPPRSATHHQLQYLQLQSAPTPPLSRSLPSYVTVGTPSSSSHTPYSSHFAHNPPAHQHHLSGVNYSYHPRPQSLSHHTSPHMSSRSHQLQQPQRGHYAHGRLKGTDVNNQTAATAVAQAATKGLPRTLSQLELISDISTAP